MSNSGGGFANDQWNDKEEYFQKIAPFKWVLVIVYAFSEWYHLDRQQARIQRLRDMGKFLIIRLEVRGFVDLCQLRATWFPILHSLAKPGDYIQIFNEPNHEGEGFGGSDDNVARQFSLYWVAVYGMFKAEFPLLNFGFPPLAVMQNDVRWIEICKKAILVSDLIFWHIGWQYDNVLSFEWGLRDIKMWRVFDWLRNFPRIVTEYCDTTPGRPEKEKIINYKEYLRQHNYFPNCVYITDDATGEWADSVLSQEACDILGGWV